MPESISTPAIVVIAYNRPGCLRELLQSLANAHYPGNSILLVISIDKSDIPEVTQIAEAFEWKFGEKKIITTPENLGLKEHVLKCGDLTGQFGSVILLEDDLLVSPSFYAFTADALNFYQNDKNIAGISLYSYQVAENRFFPFYPHQDGSDVYFMQLPSSWGEAFTVDSWNSFRNWLKEKEETFSGQLLPAYITEWSVHSWKKKFVAYMIEAKKYFVYPRISYSTNHGEPGVNADRKGLYEVPLMYSEKQISFIPFSESLAVYDASFEIESSSIKKLNPKLYDYNFETDLHGTKSIASIKSEYLLSSQKCNQPVLSFGRKLSEPLQDILFNTEGDFFSLGKKSDFTKSAVDPSSFYVSVNPIRDILFDSYRKELDADFQFSKRYPRFFIGIVADENKDALTETLQSIFKQPYPSTQLQIVVFQKYTNSGNAIGQHSNVEVINYDRKEDFFKKLCNTIDKGDAEYHALMRSGDIFYENAFDAVNKILTRYPDINWLTGIETVRSKSGFNIFYGNTATRRWNRRIFERNLYKNSGRYIPPSATFWKRYLWNLAKENIQFISQERFFDEIWLAFFKVQKLYTCDVYLSSVPTHHTLKPVKTGNLLHYSLVEDKFRNRMYEFFFVNNIPYLRVYYKLKNDLPEVIRLQHETQWYFQSDF